MDKQQRTWVDWNNLTVHDLITGKQKGYLKSLGFEAPGTMFKSEASAKIQQMLAAIARQKEEDKVPILRQVNELLADVPCDVSPDSDEILVEVLVEGAKGLPTLSALKFANIEGLKGWVSEHPWYGKSNR